MFDPYPFIRPWLFSLDPEKAHDVVLGSMDLAAKTPALWLASGKVCKDPIKLLGLTFPNRVGLAAGLDKNAAHIDTLAQLGFGFIEVGTVTPKAQPGNPKPRMFRLPEHNALINRLGFNNGGVDQFLSNVAKSDWCKNKQGLIGLNIGKNANTPIENALDDYSFCLTAVYPHAAYVTVNISSPNTKNLRQLQGASELDALLGALRAQQQRLADEYKRYVPMLVKIAPDLDQQQLVDIVATLTRHKIDGVIATNTTLNRESIKGHPHAEQAGGLSGQPVYEASNQIIAQIRAMLPNAYPIIGVGGIMSAEQAAKKIQAGADLVQLYTGLIYKGPKLVSDAAHAIAKLRSHS
jgi:dihydroorotate dehydrogenase